MGSACDLDENLFEGSHAHAITLKAERVHATVEMLKSSGNFDEELNGSCHAILCQHQSIRELDEYALG